MLAVGGAESGGETQAGEDSPQHLPSGLSRAASPVWKALPPPEVCDGGSSLEFFLGVVCRLPL